MSVSVPRLAPMADETAGDGGGEAVDNAYITTRQAAQILGVNRATVINWAKQGRFNAIQYGSRGIYRFDRLEIVAFLNRSRLQSHTTSPSPNGTLGT